MDYHTSKEQNEMLTRVGSGTPMGELLRRYWWPVGFSADLKEKPTMVRLLCEDLVLFRDALGRAGVLSAHCPHRRANLCLGRTNAKGLRCRYHGWLFDVDGNTLETPGEPADSKLKESVKQPAYPVQELGGLVFTYLGPQPVPLLPRYHVLAAEGQRSASIQAFNNSNWLQNAENGMDPYHVSFLHSDVWDSMTHEPEKVWFEKLGTGHIHGCIYKTIRPGRKEGEFNYRDHPIIMPGIVFGGDSNVSYGGDNQASGLPAASMRWSVPIDDTHTMNVRVFFRPFGQKQSKIEMRKQDGKAVEIWPFKEYLEGQPTLGYTIPSDIAEEDATMLDSLGPISDRENEHLSVIDQGVVMLREMLFAEMKAVQEGRDPKGVIRDATENELIVMGASYRWIMADEREQILENA
jgi:5,5'-dehydrodivanillate O-demethylase